MFQSINIHQNNTLPRGIKDVTNFPGSFCGSGGVSIVAFDCFQKLAPIISNCKEGQCIVLYMCLTLKCLFEVNLHAL